MRRFLGRAAVVAVVAFGALGMPATAVAYDAPVVVEGEGGEVTNPYTVGH